MSDIENTHKDSSEEKSSNRKESQAGTKPKSPAEKEPPAQSTPEDEGEVTPCMVLLRLLKKWKRPLILVLTPLIFTPLAISSQKELRCAFCVAVVAVYWMTEVLPLAVTAMLPVFLYPLTGVLTCKAVAQQFVNDTNFLFIGGLIAAVAIEKCNLHKRIALFILNIVGSDPKLILLGLMLATGSLSMFISNTATTAMMVPLVQSLSTELTSSFTANSENQEGSEKACKQMSKGLVLCICIASSIGGTGTLTGTPGNLVLAGQLPELFGSDAIMDYVTWFLFAFPLMCLCLAAAWCTLTMFFLRNAPAKDERVTELMHKNYSELPKMSFAEKEVAISFSTLLLLWIFRDPGLFNGYGVLFAKGYYTDTTSAMIIALLLFALPNDTPNLCDYSKKGMKEVPRLMDWPTMQKRFPWDVVLLLGGGFALATGVKDSGLALMIGKLLSAAEHLPLWVLQLVTIIITVTVTNFCSNVATTTIFVPIVATLASQMEVNPLNLMLPVAITASFAFVLPVGTPPNAIVFSTGMVSVVDMAVHGFVLSAVCVVITLVYMKSVALLILPLNEFPTWGHLPNSTVKP